MDSLLTLSRKHAARKDERCVVLYQDVFTGMRLDPINLLEVGVQTGGSLLMWSEYFPKAHVCGIDIAEPQLDLTGKAHFFKGRQDDPQFLESVVDSVPSKMFDVIIDDASHFGLYSKITYETLFDRFLRPGGFYAIEDWGTGYWDDWPDGCRYQVLKREEEDTSLREHTFVYSRDETTGLLPKLFYSHQFGMVGFIKQLVDEAHAGAIKNVLPHRLSKFEYMTVTEGIALIKKKTRANEL